MDKLNIDNYKNNNLEMSLSKIDDYENAKINLGTSFTCE